MNIQYSVQDDCSCQNFIRVTSCRDDEFILDQAKYDEKKMISKDLIEDYLVASVLDNHQNDVVKIHEMR